LQEETGQNCYLANQVEVLRAQLVSAGLEPASVEQSDDSNVSSQLLPAIGCFLCGAFAVCNCYVKQQAMQPV